MPPSAFALVSLFASISLVVGWLASRVVAAMGGPAGVRWAVLPAVGAFLAFYVIGHRLGLAVGPEIGLMGFRVALLGDTLIGGAAALAVAFGQWIAVRGATVARR